MTKLLSTLVVLGAFALAPGAHGDQGFGNETVEGTFVFSAQGALGATTAGIPAGTPVVVLGVIEFFDDGTCQALVTINVGGSTFVRMPSDACTFEVGPDGIGTLEVVNIGAPFSPAELKLIIVDENELLVITTDELVLNGVAKRQRAENHDDNDD